MLKNKTIVIPLSATAKRRYTDLRYEWCSKKELEIKIEDLPVSSHRKVIAVCDECGKEIELEYRIYLKRLGKHNGKYLCKECFNKNENELKRKTEKARNTCLEKYGVENATQLESTKEKMRNTNIERYGTDNIMEVPEIVEKIKETNLKRYGYEYAVQMPNVIEKARQAIFDKYGVNSAFEAPEVREKSKQTCREKYGVDYAILAPEIGEKAQTALVNLEKCLFLNSNSRYMIY